MNQYGIRLRKKALARLTKEQRKVVWESLPKAVAVLQKSKGSQRVHATGRR